MCRHRQGAGARAFGADVDQISAFFDQGVGLRDSTLRIEPQAAIGEGVGGDIEHRHDKRPFERELKAAALKPGERLHAIES